MVRLFIFMMLAWVSEASAAEGMIVVLEAPMFRRPDASSEVIQYVRKGKRIYIHPAVVADREKFAHHSVDQAEVDRRLQSDGDPMPISPELSAFHDQTNFILTKDNQGRDAWMLREHVHVFYEDKREYTQKDPIPDPTDYRLLEPLPDGYPIVKREHLRGNFAVSLGSPYTRTYPYNQKIKAEAYGYQMEVNGSLVRRLDADKKGRWFGGGVLTVRTTDSQYTLESRKAQEQWTRLGGGAQILVDAWKTETQRLSILGSLIAYPYAQATITQSSSGVTEARNYRGYNFGARVGTQWNYVHIISDLDLVIGLWGEMESPMQMQAKSSTNRPQWWGGGKSDTFNPSATFTFAGTVGLQSSY